MADAKSGKGNPAHTRMMNEKLKARRQRSWNKAQANKVSNRLANEAQAKHNKELREQGLPTPHEAQKAKRRAIRDALREQGLLPPVGYIKGTKAWLKEDTTTGGKS